jgi:uncharacterized protein (TIGR00251 family)
MTNKKPYYWKDGEKLYLQLHLQPGAKRNALIGTHGDRIKICIIAPPVDNKANAHLIKFLAEYFGVAKQQVTILKGLHSRDKLACIVRPKGEILEILPK